MEKEKVALSAVVLCYKEGQSVRDFLSKLENSIKSKGISYEIIPVANYYQKDEGVDEGIKILKELAFKNPNIRPVSEVKHGKFGWDVRSGLKVATGEAVAFIDGDGQNPPEDVVKVYDALVRDTADMAQTYRTKRGDGMQRILNSRIYNFILRILFPRVRILDANSKPKIFTRSALSKLDLKSDDWFIDAEIVIQATNLKFKVSQVPTVFHENAHRSSYVQLSAILEFLRNLIAYRFKNF
jgi:glycosyltransferase involved in cell wall biosynthesis